jgi:hypothetical protein
MVYTASLTDMYTWVKTYCSLSPPHSFILMRLFNHFRNNASSSHSAAPPAWAAAPEQIVSPPLHPNLINAPIPVVLQNAYGKYTDAPDDEYQAAESFCEMYPPYPPQLVPSHIIDNITSLGGKAWGLNHPTLNRFSGSILNPTDSKGSSGVVKVTTTSACGDVCLMSNYPILAGLYGIKGKTGVYYEILINRMDGLIAIGKNYIC